MDGEAGPRRGGVLPADGLVGRGREVAALRGWLDEARGGAGRLVLCAGEPGIGKTRLAREFAGMALAGGCAVAWGRCAEAAGAPAFWPWRQVLRSLGIAPDPVLGSGSAGPDGEAAPEDRFRVLDGVADAVATVAARGGLTVILDDIHWSDEPSLLVLRHLADQVADAELVVFAAFRDREPSDVLARVLPDLLRSPAAARLDLRGFDLAEVRDQLRRMADPRRPGAPAPSPPVEPAGDREPGGDRPPGADETARVVLGVTAGNPLFVREIGRAVADGTWRPDRPPRSVLDVVAARLERVGPGCRRLVQAAAIVGRRFGIGLVASVLAEPVDACLTFADEGVGHGLLDRLGAGEFQFTHALTRDAVEASLAGAATAALHRAAASALAERFADDLSDHLADIARHWAQLAPHGPAEASAARAWSARAAEEAVRRLAYAEGVRLYRAALAFDRGAMAGAERCRLLVALGRAAYLAGDLAGCVDAATRAAEAGRAAGSPELVAEAALVLEAAPGQGVNAVADRLCEEALAGLGAPAPVGEGAGDDEAARRASALRARLLAQRAHLAFYGGAQDRLDDLSATALAQARASGDDQALGEALRARQEACPGPAGRAERLEIASEMLALARRTGGARSAMWGELWRIEALLESGLASAAAEELTGLRAAVERVGGPVSAWHLDRATACVAQTQGRYGEAQTAARRGFDRMRAVEPAPAGGAYMAMLCALAGHVGLSADAERFAREPFDGPPRFRTMAPLTRAVLFVFAGFPEDAAAAYQLAGPPDSWSLPAFFVVPGHVSAVLATAGLVTAGLGRPDELAELLRRLSAFRGEHVIGGGVAYLGPTELALGRGALALGLLDGAWAGGAWAGEGWLDAAVDDLAVAADRADRAAAPGFAAEARYHLATALRARAAPGDRERAAAAARDADRVARALGMTAYLDRTAALVAELGDGAERASDLRARVLSPREEQVARLVADGLTNRQIAARLVISERTAQNHVQHILTKLGFSARSQIATWVVRAVSMRDE
ncbi:helix-turn-helix transcriptional regulator [Pseudofrankia inefficax]|uniref:Transcriptional regulator, LuxR family n=1 Tax=Pseudofrankia inefficax (strain DSM 45817 / CECT 9037 / DDB 130130 / EuI1c) TaxID=298654 RepID=E3J1S0_PSEI1|nr:LuxR family transcriptional regulator [Pseudofrankia inefficax]ADP82878.1 transcriptional regulator, LuxR family [Pseudofrankia inefficax]